LHARLKIPSRTISAFVRLLAASSIEVIQSSISSVLTSSRRNLPNVGISRARTIDLYVLTVIALRARSSSM